MSKDQSDKRCAEPNVEAANATALYQSAHCNARHQQPCDLETCNLARAWIGKITTPSHARQSHLAETLQKAIDEARVGGHEPTTIKVSVYTLDGVIEQLCSPSTIGEQIAGDAACDLDNLAAHICAGEKLNYEAARIVTRGARMIQRLARSATPLKTGAVYLVEGKPHRFCDCSTREGKCPLGVERNFATTDLSRCLVPAPDLIVSTDGAGKT